MSLPPASPSFLRAARPQLLLLAVLAGICWIPLGFVAAPAAALLMLWLPGRSLLRLLPPVATLPGRLACELGASLLLMPLPLHLLWTLTNHRGAVGALVVAVNAVLIVAAAQRRPVSASPLARSAMVRGALWLLLAYVSGCIFCFYWLPSGGGRVASSPSGDYIKHHAVLWSLSEYPLPLHNLFFAAEADAPYYYYHLHYLLPVGIRRMAGDAISLGTAFGITSAVVAGLFVVLTYLIARRFLQHDAGALLAAACASVIGGWDIIPVSILHWVFGRRMVVVLDSWSPFTWRIHNVLDNFIWCPQHVAAVVGLLLCVYWVQSSGAARWWLIVAPLAAASVFMTSVYQSLAFMAGAGLLLLLRARGWRRFELHGTRWLMPVAGVVVALAFMIPQALHYQIMGRRYPGGLTTDWGRYEFAFFGRHVEPGILANFLDAPWLVLLEFGLPGFACLMVTGAIWRRAWRDPGMQLLALAGAVGLITMFVIRSSTTPLDYAFRAAVMPANLAAAVMAGALLRRDHVRRWLQWGRWPMIVVGGLLGLPAGAFELPVMATRTVYQARYHYDEATVLRYLRDELPGDAVLQPDPLLGVWLPQVIHRRTGVLDPDSAHVLVLRPPQPSYMYDAFVQVQMAFETTSSREAYELLKRWRVTHVLAGATESRRFGEMPQFDDVRYFHLVFSSKGARVYALLASPRPAPAYLDGLGPASMPR